jgi:predicted ferric reductase
VPRHKNQQAVRLWSSASIGPLLIAASVFCTLSLWMGTKIERQDWFSYPALYGSKTCALTAATLMSWLMLLASKTRWVERLFGGIDRAYAWHRKLGLTVGVLLLLHPLFLAEPRIPRVMWALSYLVVPFPYPETNYQVGANLGALVLIGMIGLLFLARRLSRPYQKWLNTHRWMGAIFLLSLLHIALVDRDVAHYPLLRGWLWSWLLFGAMMWLSIRLFPWWGPQSDYRVAEIDATGDLLRIRLTPVAGCLQFEPGQWVFVEAQGVGEPGERHPLSIASAPREDGVLELGVRVVGPWTAALKEVRLGALVRLYGPFGVLGRHFLEEPQDLVCIGGGIGITPFLGLWDLALHSEERSKDDEVLPPTTLNRDHIRHWKSPRVQLLYLVKDPREAIFDPWIRQTAIASRFHGLEHAGERGHIYELVVSSPANPVSLKDLSKLCGGLDGKKILLCGPPQMISAFREQAHLLHLPADAISSELFEWRAADS